MSNITICWECKKPTNGQTHNINGVVVCRPCFLAECKHQVLDGLRRGEISSEQLLSDEDLAQLDADLASLDISYKVAMGIPITPEQLAASLVSRHMEQ